MIFDFEQSVRTGLLDSGISSPWEKWFDAWHKLDWLRDKIGPAGEKYNDKGVLDYSFEDLTRMEWRIRKSIGLSQLFLANDGSLTRFRDGHAFYENKDSNQFFFMFVDSGFSSLYSAWNRLANVACIFWPKQNGGHVFPMDLIGAFNRAFPNRNPAEFDGLKDYFEQQFSDKINSPRNTTIHTMTTAGDYFRDYLQSVGNEDKMDILEEKKQSFLPILIEQHRYLIGIVPEIFEMINAAQKQGHAK